jgi:hypothetical protein
MWSEIKGYVALIIAHIFIVSSIVSPNRFLSVMGALWLVLGVSFIALPNYYEWKLKRQLEKIQKKYGEEVEFKKEQDHA